MTLYLEANKGDEYGVGEPKGFTRIKLFGSLSIYFVIFAI